LCSMVAPTQPLPEPLYFWAEAYTMLPGSGRRRAVSTQVRLLEAVTTVEAFWDRLALHSTQAASLSSLHVFREGITPKYDDPKNLNGGHFKTKPHSPEDAMGILRRIAQALVTDSLPYGGAINGLTLAQKARTTIVKLWVADSLNHTVVRALSKWLDANVGDMCGRRQFSPHKYILTTVAQQNGATQESATSIPSPPLSPNRHPIGGKPFTGLPPVTIPQASPLPAQVKSPSNALRGTPTLGDTACNALYITDPILSPPVTPRLLSPVDLLMNCQRSDPNWAASKPFLGQRLEATLRKCEVRGKFCLSGWSDRPTPASPSSRVSSVSDTSTGSIGSSS
jgi:hypothetical protein